MDKQTVLEEVLKCLKFVGNGYIGQGQYPMDVFKVFVPAYDAGLCGDRKAICGDTIRQYARDQKFVGSEDMTGEVTNVNTVAVWWEAWALALDNVEAVRTGK